MIKTSNFETYQINSNSSNPYEQKYYDQNQTKLHRKSSQNGINKTMEKPNLQPIPTNNHDCTHQGIKKHIQHDFHFLIKKNQHKNTKI